MTRRPTDPITPRPEPTYGGGRVSTAARRCGLVAEGVFGELGQWWLTPNRVGQYSGRACGRWIRACDPTSSAEPIDAGGQVIGFDREETVFLVRFELDTPTSIVEAALLAAVQWSRATADTGGPRGLTIDEAAEGVRLFAAAIRGEASMGDPLGDQAWADAEAVANAAGHGPDSDPEAGAR